MGGGVGGLGLIAIVLIGWMLGVDVTPLLGGLTGDGGAGQGQAHEPTAADERAAQFVSVTLADTEDVWSRIFIEQVDARYEPAELVLFKGATQSACGGASAVTGPFYCPVDERIYLDTGFFTTLEQRLGAGGDFAAAYVVAHEVAHHVQQELGILAEANRTRARMNEADSNAVSVRIELQADCYSGIWARAAEAQFGSIEPGDIAEAMNAARRIGDDALQRGSGGAVRPETFTHGTSDQREAWFARGYESGDIVACDTFGTDRL
ncbi:zinc metallopeptidase, putative [Oceanicola granulosus HTCC2516]|uniref:Zinc metallopeptidase, putative n=1 Tax=Oceanicola granulosus (strain ATCC BAA-861 / DSM 15982 / KCTC 12143 / HTCC2516) TaxID=314256 RepID=Q2CD03_OCEGH|nr:zinc metallopeptidase, putative [Oceanicola granulosus HTCC2516]